MATRQDQKISHLVEELDRLVQRGGAWVRLERNGGGPDEGRIVANRAGYLRFGIELLKAGLAAHESPTPSRFPMQVDLKYLITEDSVIGFHEFVHDEGHQGTRPTEIAARTFGRMALGMGCIATVIGTFVFAVVGFMAVIGHFL
jgi:hypothetical protein